MLGLLVKFLIIFLLFFYFLEWRLSLIAQKNKFCINSSEINNYILPQFSFDVRTKKHVNSGGSACLEDIVKYVNSVRAGKDGYVGTKDDELTLEEQINLLYHLLRSEFSGGFWVDSPWHLNHNAGVSGQFKLLYGDMHEYLAVYGHRVGSGGGYSGTYKFDVYDFLLEGVMFTQFVGNMTRSVFTPHAGIRKNGMSEKFSQYENVAEFTAFMPKNSQKLYAGHPTEGVMMLEYARGPVITSIYTSILMPFFFNTLDFRSLWLSVISYTESILRNSLFFLFKAKMKNYSLSTDTSKEKKKSEGKDDQKSLIINDSEEL